MQSIIFTGLSLILFYMGITMMGGHLIHYFDPVSILFLIGMFLLATLECKWKDIRIFLRVLLKGSDDLVNLANSQWVIKTYSRYAFYGAIFQVILGLFIVFSHADDMARVGSGIALTLLSAIYFFALRWLALKPIEVRLELMEINAHYKYSG